MPRHTRDAQLEQFWRRHLKRQPASGLTIRDYCRTHALREPSFYAWRRTIRARDNPTAHPTPPQPPVAPAPTFLPVTLVDSRPPAAAPLDIRLANGHRLRVHAGCDRALLAEVLAILHPAPKSPEPEAQPC
ncbi:MAG: hypothetical protein JWO38_5750 [Gemmataceae bacterium]|nr:hypothetical protein [Gemmataceae bacterium]